MSIPGIKRLLYGSVEHTRVEFKEGWNPKEILHTICGYANDYEAYGSGYWVIGLKNEGESLQAVGLSKEQLDSYQRKLVELSHLLKPQHDVRTAVDQFLGKDILVVRVTQGGQRPYTAPESLSKGNKVRQVYIRQGAVTRAIKEGSVEYHNLLEIARSSTFDKYPNYQVTVQDLDLTLIRDYLQKEGSRITEPLPPLAELAEQMDLMEGPVDDRHPRNFAVLLFTKNPQKWFRFARIELV